MFTPANKYNPIEGKDGSQGNLEREQRLFEPLVWLYRARGAEVSRARAKVEEYLTNEKTSFLPCAADDIRFASAKTTHKTTTFLSRQPQRDSSCPSSPSTKSARKSRK